jgi:Pectate lyase superfamily protein
MGWKRSLFVIAGAVIVAAPVSLCAESTSYYPLRLEDKKAVYLVRNEGGLHGDGVGDDTEAIQQAINKVQETTGQGIVFVPEGRYRLSKTVFLWPGVRLIGWGAHRPAFVLGKNTPGYQLGMGYMLMFTGNRPRDSAAPIRQGRPQRPVEGVVPLNPAIPDANPGTFYIVSRRAPRD